jgi:hypothetical protein
MTGPGQHSFTGNDLQTLDQPLFQVLDSRLWILDFRSPPNGLLKLTRLLTQGSKSVNVYPRRR